jgi:hypothetical protein
MNVTANSVSVRDPHQAARRGGRYGREQQGEFHSSFSLLKEIPPGIFKGPCQTIAIARGTVGGNNPLQYRPYESAFRWNAAQADWRRGIGNWRD